jgi:hypothetical protein
MHESTNLWKIKNTAVSFMVERIIKNLTEKTGGEVGLFIESVRGKIYLCHCGFSVATTFKGFKVPDGSEGGLNDEDGNKWYIYTKCTNSLADGKNCRRRTPAWNMPYSIDSAKRELEKQLELFNIRGASSPAYKSTRDRDALSTLARGKIQTQTRKA